MHAFAWARGAIEIGMVGSECPSTGTWAGCCMSLGASQIVHSVSGAKVC
jgi:hypothetical protein